MTPRTGFHLWLIPALLSCSVGSLAAQASADSLSVAPLPRHTFLRAKDAARMSAVLVATMFADGALREDVQEFRSPVTNHVARVGNAFGSPQYLVPALGALWLGGRITGHHAVGRAAWRAGEAGALAGSLSWLMKFSLGRVRPLDGADPDRFRPLKGNGAFPSGHTTVAFAVATALARETQDRWTDVGLYGLASLTALSRLNDDRHWTSDVLAGAMLGSLVGRQIVPSSAEADRGDAHFMITPREVGVSVAF